MNFAEGKGPKQVKKPYVLGQFTTIYGNDGTPGTINPANPPYSPVLSGNPTNGYPWSWSGGTVGSLVPGLNLNVNGNGSTDVSLVCAPGANETVTDAAATAVTLFTEVGWSGTCTVNLQGTANRMWDNDDPSSAHWVTISGVTVSGTGVNTFTISPSTIFPIYNAYRLTASGATASGIIDWSIAGMFVDLSAMRIGSNASDANGNIGQMSIQAPTNYTISGGQYSEPENATGWEYQTGIPPYAATANNSDYIAP